MKEITNLLSQVFGPHKGAAVFVVGEVSKKALILLHGRGGSAEDIVSLTTELKTSVYTLVPEAVSNVWYPGRFLLPQIENQPALDSALSVISELFMYLETLGIKRENVLIAGFSQGACLAAEYVKRNPAKYGGVCIMSGGFIGSDTEAATTPLTSLLGTPIYIGCDRADTHIPLPRVEVTAEGFTKAGGVVGLEVFTGYGHRPHATALQFLERQLAA